MITIILDLIDNRSSEVQTYTLTCCGRNTRMNWLPTFEPYLKIVLIIYYYATSVEAGSE